MVVVYIHVDAKWEISNDKYIVYMFCDVCYDYMYTMYLLYYLYVYYMYAVLYEYKYKGCAMCYMYQVYIYIIYLCAKC